MQVLTGAFLVLHPTTLNSPPADTVSVSRLAASATSLGPGLRLTRLYLPGSTGNNAFAEMAGNNGTATYAELDPVSGSVKASGALWRFPYRMAVQVHYRLADGTAGMIAVLAIGAALVLSAVSGLLFWWPGLRRLPRAIKVPGGLPERLRLRQWHRSVGALTSLLALFSAVTGLMLIIPDVIPALQPSPAASALPAAPAASLEAVDRAVAAARAKFPGASLRDIRFPRADRIDINLDAPERNARAVHTVSVRLSDASVIKALPAQDNPVLWMKVLPLHTGQSFGPLGLALLLAEAAALLFLAYAGVKMTLQSRRRNRP